MQFSNCSISLRIHVYNNKIIFIKSFCTNENLYTRSLKIQAVPQIWKENNWDLTSNISLWLSRRFWCRWRRWKRYRSRHFAHHSLMPFQFDRVNRSSEKGFIWSIGTLFPTEETAKKSVLHDRKLLQYFCFVHFEHSTIQFFPSRDSWNVPQLVWMFVKWTCFMLKFKKKLKYLE